MNTDRHEFSTEGNEKAKDENYPLTPALSQREREEL
jgi:hypothetical protein